MRKCDLSEHDPISTARPLHHLMEEEHEQQSKKAAVRSSYLKSPDSALFHDTLYAPGGFDVMRVLVRVGSRPNPRIDLGPIDCGAAIIVCDTFQTDNPIVYCSEAFSLLTGYSESETLGRNCRFLQARGDHIDKSKQQSPPTTTFDMPGMPGQKLDQKRELGRMKESLQRREEVQVMIGNYMRDGTPFANLVTVIPVRWNSDDREKRYMVGFQMCPTDMEKRSSDGV